MLRRLKKIAKEFPNDQEFGAAVRNYLNSTNTCCDKKIYQTIYTDSRGKEFMQCRKCGKLLI